MLEHLLILLIGLALVIKGADWLVDGSSAVARRAGLSEFLIGMTVVGIGTSMPELVVSLTGAIRGSADIAIGNVAGSNIFNVLLILGLTALIRPVGMTVANRRRDIPINIAVTVLLVGVALYGSLKAAGGALFLLLFAVYMFISFKTGKVDGGETSESDGKAAGKLWLAILKVVAGLAALIFGGDLLVDSACSLALDAGLSEKFVAITILAMGTSLPELVTCVVAAFKNKGALALGNIIGSNISNILLILGASALACPLSFAHINPVDLGVLLLSALVLPFSAWTGRNGRIGRGDASFFLAAFVAYMAYLIMNI